MSRQDILTGQLTFTVDRVRWWLVQMSSSFELPEMTASQSLVRTLHRFLSAVGVGLIYVEPESRTHRALAVAGYPPPMVDFLATEFVRQDATYQVVEHNPDRLMCWRDFPDFRNSTSARRWFHPYGADEGTSMMLQTTDGTRGVLHVSLADNEFPDHGLRLLEAARPEFEMLLNSVNNGRTLTFREEQVLALIAGGATNRMIASRLRISINTVRSHVENILRKLNVSSRTQAAVKAHHWISMGPLDR